MEIRDLTGNGLPSLTAATSNTTVDTKAAGKDVRRLVENEYRVMSDESALPNKRRQSWNVVNEIFRRIDRLKGAEDKDEREATTRNVVTNGKDSIHAGGKKSKSTSKTNGGNGNSNINYSNKNKNKNASKTVNRSVAPSAASTTATTATSPTAQPTTTTTPAALSPTDTTGGKSTEKPPEVEKTTTNNHDKIRSTRTVASLSSASASTMATALSCSNSNQINKTKHNDKNAPVCPSMIRGTSAPRKTSSTSAPVPIAKAPPPYEKRSATTQQHKAQIQLDQQQRMHPESNVHPAFLNRNNQLATNTARTGLIPGKNGVPTSNNNASESGSAGQPTARANNKRTQPANSISTSISRTNGVMISSNVNASTRVLAAVSASQPTNNRTQPATNTANKLSGKNGVTVPNDSNSSKATTTGVLAARYKTTAAKYNLSGKNGVTVPNNSNSSKATTAGVSAARHRTAAAKSSAPISSTPQPPAVASSAPMPSLSPLSRNPSHWTSHRRATQSQARALNVQLPHTTVSSKTSSRPPAVLEKPIPTTQMSTVDLASDDNAQKPTMYGGYIEDRPRVSLDFKQHKPTNNMKQQFMHRLSKWDPYWKIEKSLEIGLTAPVIKKRWKNKTGPEPTFFPNTAATFTIKGLLKIVGPRIRRVATGQIPVDGELRVLIRMLPLDLSKQDYGGKKRADVHLWPKGTYLQIHAAPSPGTNPQPQILAQRKQQSHDHSKWLGICHHLDITTLLHAVWSSTTTSLAASSHSTVNLGCYDSELYMFSLALCSYQSHQTLASMLLDPDSSLLKRVAIEEMYIRAQEKMESNEVTLLDDSEDESEQKANTPKELRRIIFSIRDPLTLAKLKVPVRGVKCLHLTVRLACGTRKASPTKCSALD